MVRAVIERLGDVECTRDRDFADLGVEMGEDASYDPVRGEGKGSIGVGVV